MNGYDHYLWPIPGQGVKVFVCFKPDAATPTRIVGEEALPSEAEVGSAVSRIIEKHELKLLGLGSRALITSEEDAEQDRLAHKADHDNQCAKDLE